MVRKLNATVLNNNSSSGLRGTSSTANRIVCTPLPSTEACPRDVAHLDSTRREPCAASCEVICCATMARLKCCARSGIRSVCEVCGLVTTTAFIRRLSESSENLLDPHFVFCCRCNLTPCSGSRRSRAARCTPSSPRRWTGWSPSEPSGRSVSLVVQSLLSSDERDPYDAVYEKASLSVSRPRNWLLVETWPSKWTPKYGVALVRVFLLILQH